MLKKLASVSYVVLAYVDFGFPRAWSAFTSSRERAVKRILAVVVLQRGTI
jgi:hypothetical protein